MHYWRGVITHASFLLAQPAYLAVRYFLDHECFRSRSYLNLTIHSAIWVYIATRISLPFFTSPLRRLPSPPGEKFLLCHLNFNGGKPLTTIFEEMINATPNDGILVLWGPLYLFSQVILTRPDTTMDVLNSHNYDWEKPSLVKKVLASILGEGLANVEGTKHKAMRRVVAPAFSGSRIRELAPLFYTKGLALAELMARQVEETDGGGFELMALASRVTLDIIGEAGVGMDFNTVKEEKSPLAKLYDSVANPPPFFLLVSVLFPKWLIRQLGGTAFATSIQSQSLLRKEICSLLEKKKASYTDHENSAQHSKDIIASIMKSGDFSDDYLVSQMLTFLLAGHDTTASAVTWATWMLSLHPQIQDRLQAECDVLLADSDTSDIDASTFDTQSMPFLTAVCNETLRLYPPVPSTARHAVVPTTIGNVHIAKGTEVTIPPWAVNRSRALWGADAAEFNPNRWLEGPHAATGGAESPHALLTFLHGPRSCIGQSFARLEMKCLLAALFKRFRFEVAEPDRKVEIGGFVTIKPIGGLRFKVHERKQKAHER